MITKPKGAGIPYQLRPRKAIERNLFLTLLRKLDRFRNIDFEKYRYVGFGAAFLEDFKMLHSEFGITNMDSIEADKFAFSRQKFNNPYDFINLFLFTSTDYINSVNFKQDLNQIIWWDYTGSKDLRQQLKDIEWTSAKSSNLDVLKFTFNAELRSFIGSHGHTEFYTNENDQNRISYEKILHFLTNDATFKAYLPDSINGQDIKSNFPGVIRAMALQAIKRGLTAAVSNLDVVHLASFTYADGALMTTISCLLCSDVQSDEILVQSGIKSWEFYLGPSVKEIPPALEIEIPVMTVSERVEIDKRIRTEDVKTFAKNLDFMYGTTIQEHVELVEGYCKFYKFLPYYSKVIY